MTYIPNEAVVNEAYWSGSAWPARPPVETDTAVLWISRIDPEATPPANALVGDAWARTEWVIA